MSDKPQALLERLVGQFASPYDFLRELVQNAMDAGSDLVEVELHEHPGDADASAVFELVVVDSGAGMDEEIIDGELTRLFGTSKTDDRTMAGGFGIGFVSVFAWEPERVLVQTGRGGQAWELLFREDRRFEKRPVDMPLEGTTIRLFRRGDPSQRRAIAEAVEDALHRWCRFVPMEISFEDVESGVGPVEISESFEPLDVAADVSWSHGASRAQLAFGPDPQTILLRRGLVLETGRTSDLLPELSAAVGEATARHLVVRLDSPRLRTGLARDGVVRDADRDALERELTEGVSSLREALVQRAVETAGQGGWDASSADAYSHLHAHLQLESDVLEDLGERNVLRMATGSTVCARTIRHRARLGLVALADEGSLELRLLALRSGIPVLQGRWDIDRPWLQALLGRFDLDVRPLSQAVSRATPLETPAALAHLTLGLIRDFAPLRGLQWCELDDAEPRVLGGVAATDTGVVTGASWTAHALEDRVLWLRASHPIVRRAVSTAIVRPEVAALGLAIAILARGDHDSDPLLDRWKALS
ncbi:MAG: ATP-binding protein [Nannocystales bacterium]